MKRVRLAVLTVVALALAVFALQPPATLAAASSASPAMTPCEYFPPGPVQIDVGGGTDPNTTAFDQLGGTDCSNTTLTLSRKPGTTGTGRIGFGTCGTSSQAAASHVVVEGCGPSFGTFLLKVITSGTTVQTIQVQVVQ